MHSVCLIIHNSSNHFFLSFNLWKILVDISKTKKSLYSINKILRIVTMKKETKDIIIKFSSLFVTLLLGGIGGVYLQNQLTEKSLESDLVIIDMHLEQKTNTTIPFYVTVSKENSNKEVNHSFLITNVTVVNSAYSKYPLKLVDSKLDYYGGPKRISENCFEYDSGRLLYSMNEGESIPIIRFLSSDSIYPSMESKITFSTMILFEGNYNLTANFHVWYYDAMTDKIKELSEDVYILHIRNGKLERITPLREYVTIKGYSIDDYEFGLHG